LLFLNITWAQNISTIAGNGAIGFSGDGTAATSATMNGPQDVALDTFGNVYIADAANHRIRKITAATGIMSTIAGNGTPAYTGDGGAATAASLYAPIGVAVDAAANVYIVDNGNHCIRKVNAVTGIITTVAGSGVAGFAGDGGLATLAKLYAPYDVTLDTAGNLYIADVSNNRIRKVNAKTGIISTVAGTGAAGFSGDGGLAMSAKLYQPFSVVVDFAGNMFITDSYNHRIRKVSVSTGIITTIAGTGAAAYAGDGGAASSAQFNTPYSLALDAAGNVYVSDFNNNRIRKIAVSTGMITTVVGNGIAGFSGDGGLATAAKLSYPKGIFVDKVNNIFIADELNQRIRFVCNAATIPAAPLVSSPLTLCTGSSPAPLTAIGSLLKWYTSATGGVGSSIAPIPSVATIGTTTYYVSQSSACGESPRTALVVNVINAPVMPTVTSPLTYCSGTIAPALTAVGAGLLWYTSPSGGSGSSIGPVPSTTTMGSTTYYVSQGAVGCESPRAAITVNINPTPAAPLVSDLLYCMLAPASALTAIGSNLQWYSVATGGTAIIIAPTPSTALDGTVAYYVSQTNSFACESPLAVINVRTNAKPKVNITSVAAPLYFICKGVPLTLKTNTTPYGLNYQWQYAGVAISGATQDSLVATLDGFYKVIVSNAPNCNDTAIVKLTVDTTLNATSISPTDIFLCEGVTIKLYTSAPSTIPYHYQWYKDGLMLSADTLSTINAARGGNYQLKISNASGCTALSNISSVHQYPSLLPPIINQLGSVLSIPKKYASYQWYRNAKPIAGATFNAYNISFDGTYSVMVTDSNGCMTHSESLLVQGLGLNSIAPHFLNIWPNPTSGKLTIALEQGMRYTITDVLGRDCFPVVQGAVVDLSAYPDGVYFVRLFDATEFLLGVEKVIKSSH
jgi:sugar lactone lactonase YvrE